MKKFLSFAEILLVFLLIIALTGCDLKKTVSQIQINSKTPSSFSYGMEESNVTSLPISSSTISSVRSSTTSTSKAPHPFSVKASSTEKTLNNSSQTVISASPGKKSFTELSSSAYYIRSKLSGDELQIYQKIDYAFEHFETTINLSSDFSESAFNKAIQYYRNDHPQAFYLNDNMSYQVLNNTKIVLNPTIYAFKNDEYSSRMAQINAKINSILSQIPSTATDFDVELILHDWLVNNCKYDTSGSNIFNMYGAIVEGKAVCEGYARAMQYMLYRAGIQSTFVTGYATNPSGGNEKHGWNIVKLGSKYYNLDVTWDDPVMSGGKQTLSHQFFNVTDDEINVDHTRDASNYSMPACTDNSQNYFVKKGLIINAITDADAILKNEMQKTAEAKSTAPIEVRINSTNYQTIYNQIVQSKLGTLKSDINTLLKSRNYAIDTTTFSVKSNYANPNYVFTFNINLTYKNS